MVGVSRILAHKPPDLKTDFTATDQFVAFVLYAADHFIVMSYYLRNLSFCICANIFKSFVYWQFNLTKPVNIIYRLYLSPMVTLHFNGPL